MSSHSTRQPFDRWSFGALARRYIEVICVEKFDPVLHSFTQLASIRICNTRLNIELDLCRLTHPTLYCAQLNPFESLHHYRDSTCLISKCYAILTCIKFIAHPLVQSLSGSAHIQWTCLPSSLPSFRDSHSSNWLCVEL